MNGWQARLESWDRSSVIAQDVPIPNPVTILVYHGWGFKLAASHIAAHKATYREMTPDEFYIHRGDPSPATAGSSE